MNLFLKRQPRRPEVSDAHSPYLAARREWDERYGDLITRARNWRTMAALCSLVALVATAGMVWLSARSHVVPFVVLVDNLGRPVASGIADQTSLNDDRLKRSNIFNWVENLRTVTTDGVSQRKAIDRVCETSWHILGTTGVRECDQVEPRKPLTCKNIGGRGGSRTPDRWCVKPELYH